MRASIIVSAFVFCFVIVATAVLGWNHQQTAERKDPCAPILVQENLADESPHSSIPVPMASTQPVKSHELIKQPPTEQMLTEIESIRRQLGIQLFADDPRGNEEQSSQQDFRNALESVFSKELDADESNVAQPILADRQSPPQSRPQSLQSQTTSLNSKQLIDDLQEAVFALEQRSASLEEMRRYDDSDRTRRLAHKLRKEIRTLREDAAQ